MVTTAPSGVGKKRPLGQDEDPKHRHTARDEDDDDNNMQVDQEDGSLKPSESFNNSKSKNSSGYTDYRLLPAAGEHKRAVSSVKFAPSRLTKNRDQLAVLAASASADGSVKVWDLKLEHAYTESTDNNIKNNTSTTLTGSATATTTSPTAAAATTSTGVGTPLRSMNPYHTCVGHSRGINQVCWNPIAPLLATASDDKTVRLWDAVTSDALVEMRGHASFVFCVDMHHNLLVTGSFDETVKLWDIRSGETVSTIPAHSDPVTAVGFNRDGTTICSASHDGLIRIWDVATGECLKTLYAAGNPPTASCQYTPNGKYLLAGTLDSRLRLWPVVTHAAAARSHRPSKTYHDHGLGVHVHTKYSVVADCTANGQSVVTGSETGQVVVYDLQSQRIQQVLDGHHQDTVLAVSAHDRQPLICSGGMTNCRRVLFWTQQQ